MCEARRLLCTLRKAYYHYLTCFGERRRSMPQHTQHSSRYSIAHALQHRAIACALKHSSSTSLRRLAASHILKGGARTCTSAICASAARHRAIPYALKHSSEAHERALKHSSTRTHAHTHLSASHPPPEQPPPREPIHIPSKISG